ncbi:MAG: hypothetical protein PF638_14615 [Candidatus Delongbacteria bacterium]|nr:hypothetical protein [Candidatus Delongbacteria bacterium]
MMKKVMTGLLSLVMLVIIISCSDDPVSSKLTNPTNGKVVDSFGNPIQDAKIVVSYYREVFNSTGVIKIIDPDEKDSLVTIIFSLRNEGLVELVIRNYYTKEKTTDLINGIMQVGYHTVTWSLKNSNGKYVFNDVYDYTLTADGQSWTNSMMVTYDYNDVLESEIEYIVNTKSDGSFYFNAAGLIKDFVSSYWDGVNNQVRFADYVKLWVVKDGYENVCIDSFDLMGENESLEIVL